MTATATASPNGQNENRGETLHSSPLDRAIAAAEAFIPEYDRVSAEHTAGEEAIPRLTEADKAAIKAAEDAVEAPASLWFDRAPSDRIVEMTIVWADGRRKEMVQPTPERFLPDDTSELATACEQAGVPLPPRLKAWGSWCHRRNLAGYAARPQEIVAAEAHFEALDDKYGRMLDERDKLGDRILRCKVRTPADSLRQIGAYLRLMELDEARITSLFEEDKNQLLKSLIRTMRTMAETSNVVALRKAA